LLSRAELNRSLIEFLQAVVSNKSVYTAFVGGMSARPELNFIKPVCREMRWESAWFVKLYGREREVKRFRPDRHNRKLRCGILNIAT
jgi:hypothetical protein